jgi:hypothetical protein
MMLSWMNRSIEELVYGLMFRLRIKWWLIKDQQKNRWDK